MKEKPSLEFDLSYDTKQPIALHLARISLGQGDAVVRVVLLPDGVYISVPNPEDCKFVLVDAPRRERSVHVGGLGTLSVCEDDEGEGKA